MAATVYSLLPLLLPIRSFRKSTLDDAKFSLRGGFPCSSKLTTWKESTPRLRNPCAVIEEAMTQDAVIQADTTTQQLITAGEDNGFTVVSVLSGVAFVALTILTIGVIYIAVTDFLQKRERENFEKENAVSTKEQKGKKKKLIKSRAAPRGFGKKMEEEAENEI